jgi:hypothetical protein
MREKVSGTLVRFHTGVVSREEYFVGVDFQRCDAIRVRWNGAQENDKEGKELEDGLHEAPPCKVIGAHPSVGR